MDQEISRAGRRIIDAVIEAPVAWRSPGELSERLGWSMDQTLDEIADLDARGWLEAWELIDGPVVTLSVAATASYGVRLVEVGHDETPRWARSGDPDPPGMASTLPSRGRSLALFDLVADAHLGVEQQAIVDEEAEEEALLRDEDSGSDRFAWLPRPTLLIGGGLIPWPGPGQVSAACCPACRSSRLPTHAYCLWCDRWGQDLEVVEAVPDRRRSQKPISRMPDPKSEVRRRETERNKRRSKRRERRKAQARRLRPIAEQTRSRWSGPCAG